MAEFHLHGQIIKRSHGRSAVNAAAYRAGEVLYDKRLDQTFDYTRKQEVEESIILGPDHAPDWLFDRQMLWNTVEAVERHKAAQVAREFDIALPIELVKKDPEAAKDALKAWATDMFVAQGLMVDINFHNMKSKNPHVHIMSTMRRVHPQAMEFAEGARYAFESTKARDQNDWGYMDHWRETWADYANAAMAEHGIDARIDHRTLIEQGVTDREPGIHIGPTANAMEARGVDTGRWLKNAMIWFDNEEPWFEENRRYVAFLDAELEHERSLAEEAARQVEADRRANAEALRIVVMADEFGDLIERLEPAMRAAVTAAAKSLKEASKGLDGGVSGRLAAKVTALSLPGEKLATLSPAGSIGSKKSRLAILGGRLDETIRSVVELDKRRLLAAQTGLRKAALKQLSRSLDGALGAAISLRRTKTGEASDRLDRARPASRAELGRLRSLSASLDAAVVAGVRDQAARLRNLVRRLESERPTRLALVRRALSASSRRLFDMTSDIVRAAIRAARYAGESVTYTLATIAGRSENPGRERERVAPLEPMKKAVERQADPQSTASNDRAHAEWLLFQLQALKTNIVRREHGEPRLDLSLIPDRLQEDARKFGTHQMIQEWLNEADRVQASRLMKLFDGPEPVVTRGKSGFVAIRDRVPEALAEFADDKLQHDDVIRLYAEAAIRRWQAATRGQQVALNRSQSSAGSGVNVASKTVATGKPPPGQTHSSPSSPSDPYDEVVKDGRGRGGKGFGDD